MRNNLLYFLGGLAIGAVSGILAYRLYLIKSYEDPGEEEDYTDYNRFDDVTLEDVNPPLSDDEKEEIREKLNKNYEETTNYAAMYQGDAANHEHPVDSDEDESNSEIEDLIDMAIEYNDETMDDIALEETREHAKTKGKKPKIISADAVEDLPARFSIETILYYDESDSLVWEETDEEVNSPEDILGDCLDKYGFRDNDEERIYVLNYSMDTCYEIQKLHSSWEE